MKDSNEMDIKKYWQILKRRKYIFIVVSMFVMSIIVWGSFFLPKMYQAKSTVFIERNIIKNLVKGMVVTPSIEDRLRILTYAMKSRDMLMKVIRALDLDAKAKNPAEIESMIRNFRDNTKITVKGNDLFMVSYTGKDPKLARDYVNTLISKYIEENTSAKREETHGASQFLTEQIAHYKKKLEEAEDRLSKFRIEKGIYFASDEKTLVSSIKDYRNKIEEAQVQIKELEAKRKDLQEILSGEKPLPKDVGKGKKNMLKQRLSQLEEYLPLLLLKYTENHPDVIKTKAEIESIRHQLELMDKDSSQGTVTKIDSKDPLYQQIKEELLYTESEIVALNAKIDIFKNSIKKIEAELKHMPEEKKTLATLVRERNTYQQIYEQLLSRLGQAEVSKQMELEDKGTSFRIVDPAVLPTTPVSPDRIKFILFGIVAGIAAGIGTIFLLEHIDSSIRDIDTLKTAFNLPVLAVIPKIVTKEDMIKKKKIDRSIYAISIVYLSIIGGLFIKEIIERFL
jgi:polysaccharide chain length determinant protein (PEP-CTERM system associated)